MKCPICNNELRISKKNPDYALCDTCRKKFRLPKQDLYDELPNNDLPGTTASDDGVGDETEEFHLRYANIPPREVRKKREAEMRKAYDELLSIGKEETRKKRRGLFGRRK